MHISLTLYTCVHMLLTFAVSAEESLQPPMVRVSGGDVMGSVEESYHGRKYFAFRGIPFVKSPTRLEHSELGNTWEGILNATKPGVPCAQSAYGSITGEEDCLHLSVYTPKITEGSNSQGSPVLVWLHGGAFMGGSAADYSPHLLMDKDMVIVIPQYRLGILGFFSYHASNSSDTYGMIDQLNALKWVHENIAAFGGDPSRVTLGGDCAGGASALYHMISPLSEGLYKRVISFSGSPLNTWALYKRYDKFMLSFCVKEKCPPHQGEMMKRWIVEMSELESILENQMTIALFNDPYVGNFHMGPSVQKPEFGVEEKYWFLRDHPLKIISSGNFSKVPVLLSITSDIGSYMLDWEYYRYYQVSLEHQGEKRTQSKILPMIFYVAGIKNGSDLATGLTDYYIPKFISKEKTLVESFPELKEMFADLFYRSGIHFSAKLLSKYVPTRLLSFGYDQGPKLFYKRHPDPESAPPIVPGISHGDELFYFLPYERHEMTEDQEGVSSLMVDMIDNYVNGRESVKDWSTYTPNGLETMFIREDGEVEMNKPFVPQERKEILESIFKEQFKMIYEEMETERKRSMDEDIIHEEL